MEKMILILHITVCVLLILLVLLQSGKEGMGVIFGGGTSSLFGSSGAGGILVKFTTFIAALFLLTSLSYNLLNATKYKQDSSILEMAKHNPFRKQEEPPLSNNSDQNTGLSDNATETVKNTNSSQPLIPEKTN